ncbi:ATP-binding protein [Desulfovibrio sp. TomC]|uniref:ATP-binding protein n=1 Tax=Desulfovibrio sp. TomC TaxID=1562888 RepID=UPI000574351E|nr:ATP-binding protein [Desulfovibrio sp. TomC]KHK02481.1 putative DNA mismatch repair protein [Desulfovibrio sp. TomC]
MAIGNVKTTQDHLDRLSRSNPTTAIVELIWNALDAGGSAVEVTFETSNLGGISAIEVKDFGDGIDPSELDSSFGKIGDSLKKIRTRTPEGRTVHGSLGQGRFKAFALGAHATWNTTFKRNEKLYSYQISVIKDKLNSYRSTEPKETTFHKTGTVLRIDQISDKKVDTLVANTSQVDILQSIALYLMQYKDVNVTYDRKALDPSLTIKRKKKFILETIQDITGEAELTIIEWNIAYKGKKLYLCDTQGFSRDEIDGIIKFPGYDFTAYLQSESIDELYKTNELAAKTLNQKYKALLDTAKDKIRNYFTELAAEEASKIVEKWKEDKIYPFTEDEISHPVKKAESQVFDIVAARVYEHHKPFRDGENDAKELTLRLLRQAIENKPQNAIKIINEVLRLPKDKQDELAELLERTSLESVLNAANIVTKRIDTILGLEEIIFSKEWKKHLRERTQLHRLLVHELWVFGEQYTLDTDDESLKQVLIKHLRHLDRSDLAEQIGDVKLITDEGGIPDIMMSRKITRPDKKFEHLVLELKAPRVKIGPDEITQIEKYAFSVIDDERFSKSDVIWTFYLISNDFSKFAETKANSDDRPYGCIFSKGNATIWIKKWSDILHEAKYRYEFFRQKLEIEASREEGIQHLFDKYENIFKTAKTSGT